MLSAFGLICVGVIVYFCYRDIKGDREIYLIMREYSNIASKVISQYITNGRVDNDWTAALKTLNDEFLKLQESIPKRLRSKRKQRKVLALIGNMHLGWLVVLCKGSNK